MRSAATERARAKVNLTLQVHGRRADGYHDLESLVAFADCADTLTLNPADRLSLAVAGPRAAECGALDDNLILKAARLLGDRVADLAVGRFALEKHLPAAAGIGGGSADAAATLRLLARLNDLAAEDPRIAEVAQATGADVPVCLPSSTCVMRGIGERLAPVAMPRLACVLINPGVPVATKDVFGALGLKAGQALAGDAPSPIWPDGDSSLERWFAALAQGRNDLEAPALRVQPVIAEVLMMLRAQDGCRLARMSGSGATCFGLFGDDDAAARAAENIRTDHAGWWVVASTLG